MLTTHGEGIWEKIEEHTQPSKRYLMGVVLPYLFKYVVDLGNEVTSKEEALKLFLPDFNLKMASQDEMHQDIVVITSELLTAGWNIPDPDRYWKNGKKS